MSSCCYEAFEWVNEVLSNTQQNETLWYFRVFLLPFDRA